VVTIKKFEHDERRPSRQMAELLAQRLAIPQAIRENFLQMARGEFAPSASDRPEILRIPSFLKQQTPVSQARANQFVERAPELARLETCLRLAWMETGRQSVTPNNQ
jgi:hypothetical protein